MSQEIIYTSAPQGLRPGSFGFCIVAMTTGMPTPLAERLESLSGYRHVYSPGDPRAVNNPVVHSHVQLKIGAQKYFVLSRLADAGFDYSQRTNKLVHHVALEPSELVPAGPAWVLSQPGYMVTSFSGQPHLLPAGRRTPAGEIPRTVCHRWGELTGDPGWGAVLASSALTGGALTAGAGRPVHLIVPEGLDPLPLIVEAQSLLPSQRRWEVSFSTFFTRLPPGVECQWRCVLAGTPEATALAGMRGDLVIDLTRPLGPAPETPLSAAARTGVFPAEPAPTTRAIPTTQAAPVQLARPVRESAAEELRLGPPPAPGGARARTSSSGVMIIDDGPPELPGDTIPPPMTSLHRRSAPSAGFGWSHLTAVAMVAALVGVVVGYLFRSSQTDPAPIATQTAAPAIPATDNQPPAPPAAAPPAPQPPATPPPRPPTPPPAASEGEKTEVKAKNPSSANNDAPMPATPANGGTATPAAVNPPMTVVPTPVPAPPAVIELKYGPEPLESIRSIEIGGAKTVANLVTFPNQPQTQIKHLELLGVPSTLKIVRDVKNSSFWDVRYDQNTGLVSAQVIARIQCINEGSNITLALTKGFPSDSWKDLCVSALKITHANDRSFILHFIKPEIIQEPSGKPKAASVDYSHKFIDLLNRYEGSLYFDVSSIKVFTIPDAVWLSSSATANRCLFHCQDAPEISCELEWENIGQVSDKITRITFRAKYADSKDKTTLLDDSAIETILSRRKSFSDAFFTPLHDAETALAKADQALAMAKEADKKMKEAERDAARKNVEAVKSSRTFIAANYPSLVTTAQGLVIVSALEKSKKKEDRPRMNAEIGRVFEVGGERIKIPLLRVVELPK